MVDSEKEDIRNMTHKSAIFVLPRRKKKQYTAFLSEYVPVT